MRPHPHRSPPARSRLLPELGLLAGVLAVALAVRLWFLASLDLRDLPGPASGTLLMRFVDRSDPAPPPPDLLIRGLWALSDHLAAAHLSLAPLSLVRGAMVVLSLLGVLGATLAGRALGGRWGALGAGLLAATWSLAVQSGLMISYDTAALGLGWLGLGMVLLAPRLSWPGLLVALPGLALVSLAAMLKEVATPLLALVAVAPLVAGRRWRLGLAFALLLGPPLVLAAQHLGPLPPGATGVATLDLAGLGPGGQGALAPTLGSAQVAAGLSTLWRYLLVDQGQACNIFLPLAAVGAVAGLLPGPRWPARLAMVAAALVCLGLSTSAITVSWMRLRYLEVPGMVAPVLAGVNLGLVGAGITRLGRGRPWSLALGALPLAAGAVLLLLDAIDLAWEVHRARAFQTELAEPTLPGPLHRAWNVNDRRVGTQAADLTVRHGSLVSRALVGAPPGPLAVPGLRDGRERQVLALGALQGHAPLALEEQRCCSQGEDPTACATRVVAAVDGAGALLLVPGEDDLRMDVQQLPWLHALRAAAEAHMQTLTLDPSWDLWAATGSGGRRPCDPADAGKPSAAP